MVGNSIRQVGDVELAARNAAVARENESAAALATLNTRARDTENDPPPPALLVAHNAARAAEMRQAWAEWHRHQAERHRTTLTDLILHHEEQAERLMT
jgi:hypothetical protein